MSTSASAEAHRAHLRFAITGRRPQLQLRRAGERVAAVAIRASTAQRAGKGISILSARRSYVGAHGFSAEMNRQKAHGERRLSATGRSGVRSHGPGWAPTIVRQITTPVGSHRASAIPLARVLSRPVRPCRGRRRRAQLDRPAWTSAAASTSGRLQRAAYHYIWGPTADGGSGAAALQVRGARSERAVLQFTFGFRF